ncbi:MAG: polysaccharide deacetylase family protein [Hyphomicrobiales bacterium]
MSKGLMFHHFHGQEHPVVQGSIDADSLSSMLDFVGLTNILPAQDYYARVLAGALEPRHLCVTFDDTLLCQYDIAKPVLDALGITAFWFVYSSVLEGQKEWLEIYRIFRTRWFDDIDHFYGLFFARVESCYGIDYRRRHARFDPRNYLPNDPFYSDNDRWFRYLRDRFLDSETYHRLMRDMLRDHQVDLEKISKNLWMKVGQIQTLSQEGHLIGLHSHTHPTRLAALSAQAQQGEYDANYAAIEHITGKAPTTASHPCNSYNAETLRLLRDKGIRLAFRADVADVENRSLLEMPRENHANILRRMRQT